MTTLHHQRGQVSGEVSLEESCRQNGFRSAPGDTDKSSEFRSLLEEP